MHFVMKVSLTFLNLRFIIRFFMYDMTTLWKKPFLEKNSGHKFFLISVSGIFTKNWVTIIKNIVPHQKSTNLSEQQPTPQTTF
jgi:hypothetical protein